MLRLRVVLCHFRFWPVIFTATRMKFSWFWSLLTVLQYKENDMPNLFNLLCLSYLRYQVMRDCWDPNPRARPTFDQLVARLHSMVVPSWSLRHMAITVHRYPCSINKKLQVPNTILHAEKFSRPSTFWFISESITLVAVTSAVLFDSNWKTSHS